MSGSGAYSLAMRVRLALAGALLALLVAGAGPAGAESDQEEANRLIVQSVKLLRIADEAEDVDARIRALQRILDNLNNIIDVYSASDHAVTLISGGEVAGLSVAGVEALIAEAQEPPAPPAVEEPAPPAVEEQPPAAEQEPPAAEQEPPAAEQEPPAAEQEPPAAEQEPPAAEQEPPAAEQEPPAAEQEPPAAEQQPPAAEQEPPAAEQQPPAAEQEPPAAEQEPPAAEQEPPTAEQDAPTAEQEPPTAEQEAPATQDEPGLTFEYVPPSMYNAVLYEDSGGKPFISIATSVRGMNTEYVTVNEDSLIQERWTGVCWDFLGEEGSWNQTQTYQFDCTQLFPATIGQKFQIVSETVAESGDSWSEVWNVEIGYFGRDETFGDLISFAGVLERLTGSTRNQVLQEHVYSAKLGVITRLVYDADPETGQGGSVLQAVQYQQLASRASTDILTSCARNRTGMNGLKECLCGVAFFESALDASELKRLAAIAATTSNDNPEDAEFRSRIDALRPQLEAQCARTE